MKIVLVDGSALVYRSHFALARAPLTTAHGEITNAAFGAASAVLRLLGEFGADCVVSAFDVRGKTFRHELYPQYKAHRPPTPPEIRAQVPRVREIFASMNVPVLEREGYEADDVIATLAREAVEAGHEVWIYSGDKDFIPLVRPGVSLLKPAARSSAPDEEIDVGAVKKKFGVRPAQYRDVLALMGDSSDNVPGVPGIGEKTAVKLVSTFESLERLLERLGDKRVSARQRAALEEHRDTVLLAQRLVTIDDAVPLGFRWDDIGPTVPWTDEFRRLCRELEFQSLLERFPAAEGAKAPDSEAPRYHLVLGLDELAALVESLPRDRPWSVDTETTDVDPLRAELVGISLSARAGEAYFVPVQVGDSRPADLFEVQEARLPWEAVRARLGPPLEDPRVEKVGQNIKYDRLVLEQHGVRLAGVVFDTLLASYLLAPEQRSHGLDALAEQELGLRTMSYKELVAGVEDGDIRRVPLDRLCAYAAEDADVTLRLYEVFAPRLIEEGLDPLLTELELPLSEVLARMEAHGVRLDLGLLEELRATWRAELDALVSRIHESAGEPFNLNSPKQLQVVLFDRLGLKPRRKTATGYSTDVDVLTALSAEHELPAMLLEYRQLAKLLSTYVEALPKLVHPRTGRVHTSYNQAVAATGRLSSTDPNLQNIPIRTEQGRRIREAFVPRERGWSLLAADYSQIELRLMAHFAQEPVLVDAFRRGQDIHVRTAALVAGVGLDEVDPEMRRSAKAINFGILYGMGARALAQQIGVDTRTAQAFIDGYFERLPRVRAWIDATVERARREGEVRTLLGRRRRLPELRSKDPRQMAFGERIAVNTPIQGSAADLVKRAMIGLDARIASEELPARLLLQVHDELVLEVRDDARDAVAAVVREEMEGVAELAVPLSVDLQFGANWAQAHP